MPGAQRLIRRSILAAQGGWRTRQQAADIVYEVVQRCSVYLAIEPGPMRRWFDDLTAEADRQAHGSQSPVTRREDIDHGDKTSPEPGHRGQGTRPA